ncbi:PDDEXK nuclease domain-containing protein [Pseudomonas sp. MWU12-2345]|uniref:PDDEXK nuclease domain-containing protein n=1 Tax=Pseudomonas sp. MWU12-2345 TaxID=2928689 RepID=UPI00200D947B
MQAVNTQLIELYWQVGAYISHKLEQAEWGDAVVSQLAEHLARTQPGLRGFTRRNLFRMRQFYETYRGDEKVSALLTQLPWTHNLLILGQSKHPQEREFYLRLAIQEKWSTRELERQLKAALFERSVTQPAKVSAVLRQSHPDALDFYLEALDRNERKPHENPAIGVLLCASKDDEVVEYALNRSLSPALIAEYQTRLPDKQLLQAKLHEFYALNTSS